MWQQYGAVKLHLLLGVGRALDGHLDIKELLIVRSVWRRKNHLKSWVLQQGCGSGLFCVYQVGGVFLNLFVGLLGSFRYYNF